MTTDQLSYNLYPEISPYSEGMLPLDNLHTMYWEQSGNPHGVPVLFVHGGPGTGTKPATRRFFDPTFYRIILFDQRGAGRSTPQGELRENTTPHLIGDIETLRKHLGIEKWLIFGGSWGTTLGIAYAEHHTNRCLGLILRGIFLCRPSELHWLLYGIKTIFPEVWRAFSGFIPETEQADLLTAYYKRLINPDPKIHIPAARSWSQYEGLISTLLPDHEFIDFFLSDTVRLGVARLETHYFKNNIFLPENYLLDNLYKIRSIPTTIVHGRYDMCCPIVTADELAQAWPEAKYIIVPDAGHAASEPGIRAELVKTCEAFKKIVSSRVA